MKLLFLSFLLLNFAYAEDINLAVAANFSLPIGPLAKTFKEKTGHNVLVTTGASGKFYSQIQNGAPFDILLSADTAIPDKLAEEKLAIKETQFTYAIGKLVLWSAKRELKIQDEKVLLQKDISHIAIANPKLAPYGSAAMEVLQKLNILERVKEKIVNGENINQAYQFVTTQNAEVGFIALSQLPKDDKAVMKNVWIIPQNLYSPIKQDAIVLKNGASKKASTQFIDFLKSQEVKKIIKEFGYEIL